MSKRPIDLIRQQFRYIESGIEQSEANQIPGRRGIGGRASKPPAPPAPTSDYNNILKTTYEHLGISQSDFSPEERKSLLDKAEYLTKEFKGFASDSKQQTRKNFIMAIKELSSSAMPEEKVIAAIALCKIGRIAKANGKEEVIGFAQELIDHHKSQIQHDNINELTSSPIMKISSEQRALNILHNSLAPEERLDKQGLQKFEARANYLAYQFSEYSQNPQADSNKDFMRAIKSLTSSSSKGEQYLAALALDKIEMISRHHKDEKVKHCYNDLMTDHIKLESKGYEKLEEQGFGTHEFFGTYNYGSKDELVYSPAVVFESALQYQQRYENYSLEEKLKRLQYYKRDLYRAEKEISGTQDQNEFPTSSNFTYHARCESMDALALLEVNAKKVASEGLTLDLKRDIKRDVSVVLDKHTSPKEKELLKKHMDYLIEKEMKEAGVKSAIQKTKLEGVKEFFSGIFNAKGRNKAAEILASKGLKISSFVEKEKAKTADSPAQHSK